MTMNCATLSSTSSDQGRRVPWPSWAGPPAVGEGGAVQGHYPAILVVDRAGPAAGLQNAARRLGVEHALELPGAGGYLDDLRGHCHVVIPATDQLQAAGDVRPPVRGHDGRREQADG